MSDWLEKRYEKLKGKYKHYCPEWDFLAIDENSPEFECCTCRRDQIVNVTWDELAAVNKKIKERGERNSKVGFVQGENITLYCSVCKETIEMKEKDMRLDKFRFLIDSFTRFHKQGDPTVECEPVLGRKSELDS